MEMDLFPWNCIFFIYFRNNKKKEFESKYIFKGLLFLEHLTFKTHYPLLLKLTSR